jgi:hypothetical protein
MRGDIDAFAPFGLELNVRLVRQVRDRQAVAVDH